MPESIASICQWWLLDTDRWLEYNYIMRQKMLKYQKGRARPTEVRVNNALIAEQTNDWTARIDKATQTDGVQEQIRQVALVLKELAEKISVGAVESDVLVNLIRQRSLVASLQYCLARGWIKEGQLQR